RVKGRLTDVRTLRDAAEWEALNDIFIRVRGLSIHWMLGAGEQRLIELQAFRNVRRLRADVSDLPQKVWRHFILDIQVVLLNIGVDKMRRDRGQRQASTG